MRCWEHDGIYCCTMSHDEFTRTFAASRPKMSQSTGTSASAPAPWWFNMLDYARDVDFMPFMLPTEMLCLLCPQPKCYAFYAPNLNAMLLMPPTEMLCLLCSQPKCYAFNAPNRNTMLFMIPTEMLCFLWSQPKRYAFYAPKVELCRFYASIIVRSLVGFHNENGPLLLSSIKGLLIIQHSVYACVRRGAFFISCICNIRRVFNNMRLSEPKATFIKYNWEMHSWPTTPPFYKREKALRHEYCTPIQCTLDYQTDGYGVIGSGSTGFCWQFTFTCFIHRNWPTSHFLLLLVYLISINVCARNQRVKYIG